MEALWNQITEVVAPFAPRIVAAFVVFLLGWIIARILAAAVRKTLGKTEIDNRIATWFAGDEQAAAIDVEAVTARGLYYLLMLFVLVAVFQTLGLTIVTEPLNALLNQILQFMPRVLSAGLLLVIAWALATGARAVVSRVVGSSGIETRLRDSIGELGEEPKDNLGQALGEALYWFVFLLFLPGILDALALEGMMEPVRDMVSGIVGFLPNLFTALVTLGIGWILARLIQRIVSSFLAAAGLDALGERLGLAGALGEQKASRVVGTVLYVLIFIPVLITALSALRLDAITAPLSNMLNTILNSVPSVFAALLVLAVSFVIGKVVAGLVSNVLSSIGFNTLLTKLGLSKAISADETRNPASIVGSVVLLLILLFAATEAAGLLGFTALSGMITDFLGLVGHLIFGIILFGLGLFLANFVAETIRSTGTRQSTWLARVARTAILVLAGAIALRQMGVANEIINLAFGLLVGAVAVAAAIAFGLGSREVAGRHVERWSQGLDREA